jgi:uncharacterized protein YeaO (DUF488 family)
LIYTAVWVHGIGGGGYRSLLDENSDAWVVKQLAPEIHDQWRTLYQHDTETWAEFMVCSLHSLSARVGVVDRLSLL